MMSAQDVLDYLLSQQSNGVDLSKTKFEVDSIDEGRPVQYYPEVENFMVYGNNMVLTIAEFD